MKNKNKIISQILQVANKTHPDSEIILYGSQARGESNENSDWDLLILLKQSNIPFEQETKIMDDYYELELSEGIVISPLIYSKNDWNTKYASIPLHLNIDKEFGKMYSQLFAWRQKGDYADLFDFEKEIVEPYFKPVKGLIDLIENILKKSPGANRVARPEPNGLKP